MTAPDFGSSAATTTKATPGKKNDSGLNWQN